MAKFIRPSKLTGKVLNIGRVGRSAQRRNCEGERAHAESEKPSGRGKGGVEGQRRQSAVNEILLALTRYGSLIRSAWTTSEYGLGWHVHSR
jgi:hypothetical protein